MWIIKQIKKQGGFQLLKRWFFTRSFFYAVFIVPFFICSKTGLEIFRLAMNNKVHKYIKKKFKNKKIDGNQYSSNSLDSSIDYEIEPIVWVMWLQGINAAPELVQVNLKRLEKIFMNNKIQLITIENLSEFIDLPDFIIDKKNKGIISPTHFSDIVRIQLLVTYGGIWIDSTVFFNEKLPDYVMKQDFFVPQTLKPGRDGMSIPVSNWLIISKKNNAIASRTRDLLFNYWENSNVLIDYFIFHHLLMIAMEELPNESYKILPIDNSQPHALSLAMKHIILSKNIIQEYVQLSPFHKLTNKIESDLERENQLKVIQFIQSSS